MPDSLVGRLVENVVAHEVGHCIGMPQYASWSTYPVDSLRSATFLRTVGRHIPSIMGVQQNYIAQPGDGLDLGQIPHLLQRPVIEPPLDSIHREHAGPCLSHAVEAAQA